MPGRATPSIRITGEESRDSSPISSSHRENRRVHPASELAGSLLFVGANRPVRLVWRSFTPANPLVYGWLVMPPRTGKFTAAFMTPDLRTASHYNSRRTVFAEVKILDELVELPCKTQQHGLCNWVGVGMQCEENDRKSHSRLRH